NVRANHLKLTPKKLAEWREQQMTGTIHGTEAAQESGVSINTLPIGFKVPESADSEKKEGNERSNEKVKKVEAHGFRQIDASIEIARNLSSQSLSIENLSKNHQQNYNDSLWQVKDTYENDKSMRDSEPSDFDANYSEDTIDKQIHKELEEMTFEDAVEEIDALDLPDCTLEESLERMYELEFENKHDLNILENSMTNMDQEILQMRVRIADLINDLAISSLFEQEDLKI
ncbi:6741_t:CDS:2, partial [Ambispora leptoticha]